MTSNKSHTAFHELTTHEDADTKLDNAHLSTPDATIEDAIKISSTKFMKEVNYKHDDWKGFRLRDEILNCVKSIDFFYTIKIAKH